jgi:hypothetical protein
MVADGAHPSPTTGETLDASSLSPPDPAPQLALDPGPWRPETRLDLKPGQHTLQLVLGDQSHIPHYPPLLSERITITVK